MTSEFSDFSERLHEFIRCKSSEAAFGVQPSGCWAGNGAEARTSTEVADAEFNALAVKLFALQFKHNAPYRRICEARNATSATVKHWTQIPAVPTAAFKELELSCLPPQERTAVFYSSGTAGQRPSRHFHCAGSLEIYEASLLPWFTAHVMPKHLTPDPWRLALLTPPPPQAPHSSLVHMFETIRRKFGAPESAFTGKTASDGAWTLDLDASLARLAGNSKLETRNSKLILGTAFSFVHLLDFLAEENLRFNLPSGSRVMETGGYKGRSRRLPKSELHRLIGERLGIPPTHIVCEYGMSELSSQAYDGKGSRVEGRGWSAGSAAATQNPKPETRNFHFPPWACVQIISPETGREVAAGETGLLRIVDLANVFSVMAIQTEDLGLRRSDGFELIGRAATTEPRGCSLMAV